jgi:hypothetical protein
MAYFSTAPLPPAFVRDGSRLVVYSAGLAQNAHLPLLCVKCGAPANGKPVAKNFSWHHPGFYFLILIGLLIYLIVALVVRKTMKLQVPLCLHHAQRRTTAAMLAWVLPVVGIADAFILPRFNVDGGVVALTTVVLVLAGLVIWAVVSNPIRPKFIDQYRGEFSGVCESFLQHLPPVQR